MKFGKISSMCFALFVCMFFSSCGETEDSMVDSVDSTEIAEYSSFIPADSAAEAISSCSYNFRVYMTGIYSDSPVLIGNLTGILIDGLEDPLMRIEMGQDSIPDDSIDADLTLILVSGRDSCYAWSSTDNILEKGSLEEGGVNLLGPAIFAIMNEYFLDDPFADEIASQSVVAEGLDTVGTVVCETFLVTYSGGQMARWSLGLEDHIPRRVERMMTDRDGNELSRILEVYDLDISPEVHDSIFAVSPPEGTLVENYSAFLTVGTEAPLWTLQDREGNSVSLEDMKDNIVILDFWATWCTPCIAVMPQIQSVFEEYQNENVLVFGVNVWESADPMEFMDENGFTYGLLLEGDDVASAYKVSGIPTIYIIGRDGRIAFVEVGANPDIGELLTASLNNLLEAE